ncbi:MAG: 2Fe-2S iron-sulfur cluster binding domain-containing protein, partial [Mucispirillum sp.]|nr:2Fe-2S iron-sulfur cluster binding domain-containing protein [Mucispirillum sp.]
MFFFKKTCRVSVRDKQVVIETKSGTNLYKLLVDEKLIRPMLCGGTGQCGKCKIKYASSKHIPKPTYKETLILAKSNIDAGYRLACQQSVKRDMEIDISEISSSAKFLSDNASVTDTEENSINKENLSQSEETDNLTEKDEQAGQNEPVSLKDFTTGSRQLGTPDYLLKGEEGPGDGILLIQQRSGIRYYCYSAALDNIVAEGTHPYNEQLRDIIDNDMLPDFLYTELKIRDVERVMALIEANDSYGADILMDMFRYMRFDIGMQQFEMIMPKGSRSYEITLFFRLLNSDDENKLIFSLDMLSR